MIELLATLSLHSCMLLLITGVGGGLFNDPRPFNRHSVTDWAIRIAHTSFLTMLVLAWIGMVGHTLQGTLL